MRIVLLMLLVVFSCTQMKTKTTDESRISSDVKTNLDQARLLFKSDKFKETLAKLYELKDDNLDPLEKALKYNLKGVTLFKMGEIEKSILNFEVSERYAPSETPLFSQVQLNMASGYYLLNKFDLLEGKLQKIEVDYLTDAEVKKFAQLSIAFGEKNQNSKILAKAHLLMMRPSETLAEARASEHYDDFKLNFETLTFQDKFDLFKHKWFKNSPALAEMAILEIESRYSIGDKIQANEIFSVLKSDYSELDEVKNFLKDYELRLENASKISVKSVGIVLPLTGDKATFGQKALASVQTGVKILGLQDNLKIFTKDTVNSPETAEKAISDLVRDENVSIIIGGLFPESAKSEYLAARKFGVTFISLSQIYLPKEEKNQHLIEVQGSIESQIETLLSEDMILKFGQRLGIIFPDNDAGKSYLDEIWRKAVQKNVQITSVSSFPKNSHDYRDTAQLFLGLKYPRERSEELRILEDVYSVERTTSRRIQTLPPVLDFDWLFMATFPHEASQLIPTLGYYDANRLKVVGGPSWVSKSMLKEQKNLGTIYFVGDDPNDFNQEILTKFNQATQRLADLIEVMALDAIKIGSEALTLAGDVGGRESFDAKLIASGRLNGLTSYWEFKDGIWIKKMNPMTISRNGVQKVFSN